MLKKRNDIPFSLPERRERKLLTLNGQPGRNAINSWRDNHDCKEKKSVGFE